MKYLGPISNAKDLVNKEYVDNTAFSELLPLFIDVLYPVGCYFSTSDEDFNPNNSWGGTWTLLGEGKVLISGSSNGNYRVGNDYGGNTKSYTPAGSVGNHTITANEITGHTHGEGGGDGGFKIRRDAGVSMIDGFWGICAQSGNWGGATIGTAAHSNSWSTQPIYINAKHTHTSVGGGGAHNHSFTGTAATLDVMQKSTATYIWHRTA